VLWTVSSFGAALGDVLSGESSGDDINWQDEFPGQLHDAVIVTTHVVNDTEAVISSDSTIADHVPKSGSSRQLIGVLSSIHRTHSFNNKNKYYWFQLWSTE